MNDEVQSQLRNPGGSDVPPASSPCGAGVSPETSGHARLSLDAFEQLVRTRRATRHFRTDPLPDGLLDRLLDIAHWSPSGFNLQPTHYFVFEGRARREQLYRACMDQKQVLEAAAVVIFAGDKRAPDNHFERVVSQELAAGTISPEYEKRLRHYVPLSFGTGPLGVGWLWKATLIPIVRLFRPVPRMPAVHREHWATKQVMLSAMTFMLAAAAAGLATVPMEGFDETRVRRLAGIPRSFTIPVVVAVGYAAEGGLRKTRLPVASLIHRVR